MIRKNLVLRVLIKLGWYFMKENIRTNAAKLGFHFSIRVSRDKTNFYTALKQAEPCTCKYLICTNEVETNTKLQQRNIHTFSS